MQKKLLDSKLLYVIFSVIMSFTLWCYVTTVEGVTDTETIPNIPVVFEGEDMLLEKGLMITSDAPAVTMKFQATAANLVKLKEDGAVSISVDVASITQPGTYTMAYDVSYSGISRSSFSVVEQNPANITFVVESYITREVEIRGQFKGSLANGYMLELENNQPAFEFAPQMLKINGLENDVNKIAYALVTIKDKEISKNIDREIAYELIGWDEKPLDKEALEIECANETVMTSLKVQMYADIPLVVELVDGGGVKQSKNVKWDYNPKSITVSGEKADMETLLSSGKITVAKINLAEVETGETTLIKTIPLAAELTNLDGVTEVVIEITVSGLVNKTLEVTEFDVQNVPLGYSAKVQTKSLFVVVRGTEEELEEATAENLRVVADLANIDLAAGQYTVNAKIYFDGIGDAGVMGSYPLAVRLTKP